MESDIPARGPEAATDEPDVMTPEEAAAARDEIMTLSSLIAAATGRVLRLIGDVEARGNPAGRRARPSGSRGPRA
jgi:hypothetical protein